MAVWGGVAASPAEPTPVLEEYGEMFQKIFSVMQMTRGQKGSFYDSS